jgi:hypothetical protein
MYSGSHVILVRFSWNLNFISNFSKNNETPNFMKIRQMGAELFHADRQADMKLSSQLWTCLKSSYTLMMLQRQTVTLNGDLWQQGAKKADGFKKKEKQKAGINCMIKRFLIRTDNTPRYHVVRISKTRTIANVTWRIQGNESHPKIVRCGVT